jgi:hypothetical protein
MRPEVKSAAPSANVTDASPAPDILDGEVRNGAQANLDGVTIPLKKSAPRRPSRRDGCCLGLFSVLLSQLAKCVPGGSQERRQPVLEPGMRAGK